MSASPPSSAAALSSLPSPRAWPLLGHGPALLRGELHHQLEAWHRQLGPNYWLRVGSQRMFVSAEPAVMQECLRPRPQRFRRVRTVEAIIGELGLEGVFSAEGAAWKPQRRLAMEALAPKHLRAFYLQMVEVLQRLHQRWQRAAAAGAVVDLGDEFRRFTLDVTTRLVFGYDLNSLGDAGADPVRDWLELVFPSLDRRMGALVPYWRWIKLPQDRALDEAFSGLCAFAQRRIDESRAELASSPSLREQPQNFLQAMLLATDEHGRPFTDRVLIGNALTMMVAGEDTTANTLAWAMHELLDAPAAWAALRSEAEREFGAELAPADYDASCALRYAGAVAQEALRLRPAAPLLFLETLADELLAGVCVPAGTSVILCTRVPVLQAPWAEPLRFWPERWLEDDGSAVVTGSGPLSIPFGSGPRICPGRALALLELRLALSSLAAHFELRRVGSRASVRERFAFAMLADGVRVQISPRRR